MDRPRFSAPARPSPGPRGPRTGPPLAPGPLPDRPLDPPAVLATVAVRSNGLHPLIFRKQLIGPIPGSPRPTDGDLVRVVDRDGVPLGFGLWNARSQISVRLLAKGESVPDAAAWTSRLDDAVALRKELLKLDEETDAYRVVHAEGDGLSGLVVDRYADVLSAEVFSLGMYQRSGAILGHLGAALGTTHARVSPDARIAQFEGLPERSATSPEAPGEVVVREHGIRYRVRFEGGHKTGFFCDQRENRRLLAKHTSGRSVLDVCCYSGGFSLNALIRGDAVEVTAVDLDEQAIAQARENANLNQVGPRLKLVHSDAFGYLRQMGQNQRQFGVVVVDPPKLVSSREEYDLGRRKYIDLNALALELVEPGGLLVTCSCSGLVSPDDFLDMVRWAARRAGRPLRLLSLTGAGPDHPVALEAPEGAYLKAAWFAVGPQETKPAPPTD